MNVEQLREYVEQLLVRGVPHTAPLYVAAVDELLHAEVQAIRERTTNRSLRLVLS